MILFIFRCIYPNNFFKYASSVANSFNRLIMKPKNSLPEELVSSARYLIIPSIVVSEIRSSGLFNDFKANISTIKPLILVSTSLFRNRVRNFCFSWNRNSVLLKRLIVFHHEILNTVKNSDDKKLYSYHSFLFQLII